MATCPNSSLSYESVLISYEKERLQKRKIGEHSGSRERSEDELALVEQGMLLEDLHEAETIHVMCDQLNN